MIKTYVGERDKKGGANVWIIDGDGNSRALPMRTDLSNHSPTGFEWGFGGSGPAQLALALLADAAGDDAIALRMHQRFKFAVIGRLARDKRWRLTQEEILLLLNEIVRKAAQP